MVDGDKSLVLTDKTIINIAERVQKKYDIVPLYYNMRKAEPIFITTESIFEGLIAAFTGGNIGIYSNNISKIWNSNTMLHGTNEERQDAINIIKLLCMENNFVIDYAKTLYKPERPKKVHDKICELTNVPLPHFFKYAKDKEDWQVDDKTDSLVNKFDDLFINPRFEFRKLKLEKPDYRYLMSNIGQTCNVSFLPNGKVDKNNTDPMIVKFNELNKKFYFKLNKNMINVYRVMTTKANVRQDVIYRRIVKQVKSELSKFGYSNKEIADILVLYLYKLRDSRHKVLLWVCYGDILYKNLTKYFKQKRKSVQCVDCGNWFYAGIKSTTIKRCEKCAKNIKKSANLHDHTIIQKNKE